MVFSFFYLEEPFKKKNYEILDMWQKGGGGSAAQANFLTKKSLEMCSGGGWSKGLVQSSFCKKKVCSEAP